MDFSKLIERASPSEINLISKHYNRLKGFLEEKEAYDLLNRLLR
jgi:hypothetical protein